MDILISLFWRFLKIGAFSFGGGYTALSLIEREIVNNAQWLSVEEFLDVLALSQITPGPVGINSATFVGFKIMGIPGSIAATSGVILVSFILVNIVAHYFLKFKDSKIVQAVLTGLKPSIVGIIVTVVIKLGIKTIDSYHEVLIILFVVFMVMKVKLHPILAIFMSAGIGLIIF
ncbi:MAG TPA: chromate transporter [Clostridia bacterium]|nr:chromate transporter [Clostridia bacterium]